MKVITLTSFLPGPKPADKSECFASAFQYQSSCYLPNNDDLLERGKFILHKVRPPLAALVLHSDPNPRNYGINYPTSKPIIPKEERVYEKKGKGLLWPPN